MKLGSDDYNAKVRAWVRLPQPFHPAVAEGFPPFRCRRFSSYEEMNAWKREYLRAIARAGGVKWKS